MKFNLLLQIKVIIQVRAMMAHKDRAQGLDLPTSLLS